MIRASGMLLLFVAVTAWGWTTRDGRNVAGTSGFTVAQATKGEREAGKVDEKKGQFPFPGPTPPPSQPAEKPAGKPAEKPSEKDESEKKTPRGEAPSSGKSGKQQDRK
jgi:hypothetical protein